MTTQQTSMLGQTPLPPKEGGSLRNRAARLIRKIVGVLNFVVVIASVAALTTIPLVIFYDVMARALFNSPTIWALEISIVLFKALVFLPLGALLYTDSHLRVSFLLDVSPNLAVVLNLVSYMLAAALATFMIWHGAKFTMHSWMQGQNSPTLLALPLWISYVLIPIGGLNLLIVAVAKIMLVFLEKTGARLNATDANPNGGDD